MKWDYRRSRMELAHANDRTDPRNDLGPVVEPDWEAEAEGEDEPEPECECVRIDVDLDDASGCPLHGDRRRRG